MNDCDALICLVVSGQSVSRVYKKAAFAPFEHYGNINELTGQETNKINSLETNLMARKNYNNWRLIVLKKNLLSCDFITSTFPPVTSPPSLAGACVAAGAF